MDYWGLRFIFYPTKGDLSKIPIDWVVELDEIIGILGGTNSTILAENNSENQAAIAAEKQAAGIK